MGHDDVSAAADIGREFMLTALKIGAPVLLAGLAVGALAAAFQAVTQMNESSLVFVPKLLATLATVLVLLPWMLAVLCEYAEEVFGSMSTWFP